MPDLAVVNAGELVTCGGGGASAEERLGIIEGGAFVVQSGRVVWAGATRALRRKTFGKLRTIDAGGQLVTPGFVDPHSHLVFAGSREDELRRKIMGESYTSILKAGGGIARTIRETRKASTSRIVFESAGRLKQLVRNGVTTAEVKTGYGQRLEDEVKLLDAIRQLERLSGIDLVPTFLGLHASPPEFGSASEYVRYAIAEMLPGVARGENPPSFSDCFCEEGVFSRQDCSRYLAASKRLGLRTKIHADEFADSGGASLAAEMGCVSADHLGSSSESGIEAMAKAGAIAVLLPGTSLSSGIPYARARSIVKAGCDIALGTDLSPNSWVESPQLVMALACNAMKLTPAESLLAFTGGAARAISRNDVGSLVVGSLADFVIHSVPGYRYLPYRVGGSYVIGVYKRGKRIFGQKA